MESQKHKPSIAYREQQALLERRHPLISLVDELDAGIQVIDPYDSEFPFLYVNQGFVKMCGYSAEEVIGCNPFFAEIKESHPAVASKLRRAVAAQRSTSVEILNYRKDGSSFWKELHIGPVCDRYGDLIFYIEFQNDITERIKMEKQLEVHEQHFNSLFQHHSDIICSLDLLGNIRSINPAITTIGGYQVSEMIASHFNQFIIKGDLTKAVRHFSEAIHGIIQKDDISIYHKNGSTVDLELVVVPVIVDGKTDGVYAIAKDVTAYRQAEAMLRKAEKLNVVGELAAGIAHEIRNPLTSLKGFIQLMQPSLDKKKQSYTGVMMSELERIEQIVTELLLLARPQSVEFEEKNLKELLKHVRTLMNTKAVMSGTEVVLDYRCDVQCIYCEENQLKQVFINLLKNAIEAMPAGGTIKMVAETYEDENIRVCVIDEGEGISEEHLQKLGEPFYTTKEQGTGLGLMISKKIIKEHSATMVFRSPPGEGTTADIVLPVSPEVPKE